MQFSLNKPRRHTLALTSLAAAIKREQVSKQRWHNEVRLASAAEIDAELLGWLREADELG